MPKSTKPRIRYGIAEIFGRLIDQIPREDRNALLKHSITGEMEKYPLCPYRLPSFSGDRRCTKKGGVCSLRPYIEKDGSAKRVLGPKGSLTVTCPFRFHQELMVFKWAGSILLNNANEVTLVKEVGFLEALAKECGEGTLTDNSSSEKDLGNTEHVGRIDMILVNKNTVTGEHLDWCALELQGVYFSGPGMESEFKNIQSFAGVGIPFPCKIRRPDYRSSAPKRLMPQLQIKVPTLRRWGKKMAVVVDRHFYEWMGKLEQSKEVTSSDIIWFVVDFKEDPGDNTAKMQKDNVYYTTLERAVESLTGGTPVTLQKFEDRIKSSVQQGVTISARQEG